jgi:hypothetical protein
MAAIWRMSRIFTPWLIGKYRTTKRTLQEYTMGEAPGFLGTSSEVEDFARVGRRIRRAVVELGGESGEGQSADTGELLEEVVENALRVETGAASRTWRCICTEVAEDDGMTWSAEEATRAAGHAAAQFRGFVCRKRSGKIGCRKLRRGWERQSCCVWQWSTN